MTIGRNTTNIQSNIQQVKPREFLGVPEISDGRSETCFLTIHALCMLLNNTAKLDNQVVIS